MKLILAIVNNDDASAVQGRLTKEGYSVTKLATTGGFLMNGNTTFIIGTQDEKVDRAIELIGEGGKKRRQMVPSAPGNGVGVYTSFPIEITVGGAIVFVMNVERYEKL